MHLVAAAPGQHDQRGEEEDDRGDAAGDSQIVREPAGVRSASGSGTERRSETSLGWPLYGWTPTLYAIAV